MRITPPSSKSNLTSYNGLEIGLRVNTKSYGTGTIVGFSVSRIDRQSEVKMGIILSVGDSSEHIDWGYIIYPDDIISIEGYDENAMWYT